MIAIVTTYALDQMTLNELFSLRASLNLALAALPKHSIERINILASLQNVHRAILNRPQIPFKPSLHR